jgi:mannose-6-phosphate isomerase-like protein (cupin superfamily)
MDIRKYKTEIGNKAVKVGKNEVPVIMEDNECSRLYFWTDKIIFSVCTLLPGQSTPMDPGHKGAYEIIFCIKGEVVVHLPDEDRYEKLDEDDALCLPDGAKHKAINVGESIAKLSWSLAPHMGQ